jgi:hypothetical protein
MSKLYLLIIVIISLLIFSCSKKHHPAKTTENSGTINKTDSVTVKRVSKPKRREAPPKVISVNDNVARKSIDGRLYYDLLGHRYWKNYKNGRYYLFHKSMYNNDAFKPR